jgi:hypothetical protein
MPRALGQTARWFVPALVLAALAAPAAGQTTPVFNSNGFDTGYTPGNVVGQQGFSGEPATGTAGTIQTATTFSGPQAFQITGPNLINNTTFQGGNFWFQSYSTANGFNPVGSGKPFVQVQYQARSSGAIQLNNDIPFAGVYLEGYANTIIGPMQQSITPIYVNLNGGVTVFTDATTGGTNKAVSTDNNLLPREQWNKLFAELNFNTQTFRVYILGQSTPLVFRTASGGNITDVPFRNTNGTTVQIAEIGMLGFYGVDPLTGLPVQPMNNFFIDDFMVTATATSQAPVPEPGLMLAVGAVGLAGWRVCRRRKSA